MPSQSLLHVTSKGLERSPSPVLQDAQDPLEGFSQMFPPWLVERPDSPLLHKIRKQQTASKRQPKKRSFLKNFHGQQQSFVLKSDKTKGRRLIKIQIIDLESQVSSESDDNNTLLSAQYVVTDDVDQIMDQTESVINNISKKLCGYSYSF